MNSQQTLGNIIWKARIQLGLSRRELAIKIGTDHIYLSKLENNHVEPTSELIELLAGVLGLKVGMLKSAPVIPSEPVDGVHTIYCHRN